MTRLNALVTGGTGFLGRFLVDHLLQEGWQVRALVPPGEHDGLEAMASLEIHVGDVTKPESLRGAMDQMDAVFHLAALVEPWTREPREFFRVNVQGTRNVMDEALRAAVPRFLFTSSLSGIGVQPGAVMEERSPPGKVFGPYEESKAEAERLVATYVRERGLPAITLIPGIVLGPRDTRNTGKFLLSFVRGEFPGTFAEDSVLPVVDVKDVARAHLLAYSRGRIGERYIVSGQNVRWGELLRMASAASGTPMPSRHIGDRSLWLASRAGELLARVTRSPPRLPAWLADLFLSGASMDNTKSVRELGMTYRPIEETIRDAIVWFQEQGLVRRPPESIRAARPVPLPIENPLGMEDTAPIEPTDRVPRAPVDDRRRKRPENPD